MDFQLASGLAGAQRPEITQSAFECVRASFHGFGIALHHTGTDLGEEAGGLREEDLDEFAQEFEIAFHGAEHNLTIEDLSRIGGGYGRRD